jgi:hypothetical protein
MRAAPGRGTISSRRCPSPEGPPWLYGISNSSNMQSKPTVHLRAFARTGGVSRNMRKNRLRRIFAALRQRSKRAYTWTRRRTAENSSIPSRTYSDSNRHAARTIRSKTVRAVPIMIAFFIQNKSRKSSAPNPYLRVLIAAFRPKKIPMGSFLHVSAGRTQSARCSLAEQSAITGCTNCTCYHIADGPPGRAWLAKQTGRP